MNASDRITPFATGSIALTGCGWVTPFAHGPIDVVLESAVQARPAPTAELGYWAVSKEALDDFTATSGSAKGLASEIKRDKGAWMTAMALEHAKRNAELSESAASPQRVGLVVGSALAGQMGMIDFADEVRAQSARFVSPIHFPQTVGNYLAGALARAFGIRGASVTIASGAASGLDAIVEGCSLLASGAVDVLFSGGTNALSAPLAEGLAEPGSPLSEGACWFVLERSEHAAARSARPLATVTGAGRFPIDGLEEIVSGGGVLSTASCSVPEGVLIEHWTGRCLGVSGAAAVAAAIGAVHGHTVPIVDTPEPLAVRVACCSANESPASPRGTRAIVAANADGAHLTTIELHVPKSQG